MKFQCLLLTLIVVVLAGTAIGQEKTAVFDFDGIGVELQTIEAATYIFRNELQATGKFTVMTRAEMETGLAGQGITDMTCHEPICASNLGFALGAQKAVIGTLTRLGSKITAEVRLIEVATKQTVFTDRFSANTVDDLEATLGRLANAVANREQIESEVTRFDVTEEETMDPRRKKANITSGGAFGFGFPFGDSYANAKSLYNFAWIVRYEAGKYVVDNSLGFSFSGGERDSLYFIDRFIYDERRVQIFFWDIGLRYVFKPKEDFTPYIGGGLGLHIIGSSKLSSTSDEEELISADQAMALHFAGGIYMFQSYDFRFNIEGKYTVAFTDAFRGSGNTNQQFGIMIGITKRIEKKEKDGCGGGGGCGNGGCL